MNQPLPDRHEFPKDLFCFPEVLKSMDAEGFEGHLLAGQSPSPNIGSSTRCHCNLFIFLETVKQSDGVREQSGVAGDIPQRGHELDIFREVSGCGLFVAINVWENRCRDRYSLSTLDGERVIGIPLTWSIISRSFACSSAASCRITWMWFLVFRKA